MSQIHYQLKLVSLMTAVIFAVTTLVSVPLQAADYGTTDVISGGTGEDISTIPYDPTLNDEYNGEIDSDGGTTEWMARFDGALSPSTEIEEEEEEEESEELQEMLMMVEEEYEEDEADLPETLEYEELNSILMRAEQGDQDSLDFLNDNNDLLRNSLIELVSPSVLSDLVVLSVKEVTLTPKNVADILDYSIKGGEKPSILEGVREQAATVDRGDRSPTAQEPRELNEIDILNAMEITGIGLNEGIADPRTNPDEPVIVILIPISDEDTGGDAATQPENVISDGNGNDYQVLVYSVDDFVNMLLSSLFNEETGAPKYNMEAFMSWWASFIDQLASMSSLNLKDATAAQKIQELSQASMFGMGHIDIDFLQQLLNEAAMRNDDSMYLVFISPLVAQILRAFNSGSNDALSPWNYFLMSLFYSNYRDEAMKTHSRLLRFRKELLRRKARGDTDFSVRMNGKLVIMNGKPVKDSKTMETFVETLLGKRPGVLQLAAAAPSVGAANRGPSLSAASNG